MADFNENSGKIQGAGEPSQAPPSQAPPPITEGKKPPSPPLSPAEISLASENFPSPPTPQPSPVAAPFPPALPSAEEIPPSPTPPPFLGTEEPPPQPSEIFEPPPPPPSGGEGAEEGEAPPPLPTEVSVTRPKPLIFKILPFILGAIILGGLVFGIWKFVLPLLPASVKPGGVTLTYWGLWEDKNILKPLIDEYEKKHKGIKIDYKKQSPKEYRERLQTALSQEKGPDIFRFHNTWLTMLKSNLSPLPGSVFSQDEFKKTFYPVATADLKEGSSLYGIPLEIDGLALLVNSEIFKEANLSPPTTWDELQKSARILTVKDQSGKIQTAGIALGITNNVDHWSDILAVMFLQNGVDLRNPEGPLAEDVLTYYTSFVQGEGKVWDETLPPSSLAFAQGKVAMIFAPSWEILTIKEKNRSLKLKVLPIPQLPGVNIAWASYWVEGVSVKSPHQGEAWDFLKYLSQKETLVKFYTTAAQTRLFGEPYSRQDLASSLKDDPYLGPYIQQASQAQSFYLASRTFDNGINDKIIRYFEDAVNAVNRGVSPRSALETDAKGVKQVLSTYGVSTSSPKAN